MYHFLLSYSKVSYIKRKGMKNPFLLCKIHCCSLTGSGTNWALKIYYEFFLIFFFKAHFLPLPIELERWFLHQKKGHGKPFLAYEIQFSISTINSIAGALKICDKCNFQKKIKAQFVPLFIVLEKTFLYGWKGLVKTFLLM